MTNVGVPFTTVAVAGTPTGPALVHLGDENGGGLLDGADAVVTRTLRGTCSACASVGIHENAPVFGLMVAPPGAPDQAERSGPAAFRSFSAAVKVGSSSSLMLAERDSLQTA